MQVANQRPFDSLTDWIQLSREFSHHKQHSADVRMMKEIHS